MGIRNHKPKKKAETKKQKKNYLVQDGVASTFKGCWREIRRQLLVLTLAILFYEIKVEIEGRGSELLPKLRTHLLDTAFSSQTHVIGKLLWSDKIQIHRTVRSWKQRGPDCALRVVKVIGRVIWKLAQKLN